MSGGGTAGMQKASSKEAVSCARTPGHTHTSRVSMDYTYGGAEKKAVILDFGSSFIKCGFAGEGSPRHIIKSEVSSRVKH